MEPNFMWCETAPTSYPYYRLSCSRFDFFHSLSSTHVWYFFQYLRWFMKLFVELNSLLIALFVCNNSLLFLKWNFTRNYHKNKKLNHLNIFKKRNKVRNLKQGTYAEPCQTSTAVTFEKAVNGTVAFDKAVNGI